MALASESPCSNYSFSTSEGARVTQSNMPISHFHVELDEDAWTFAILVGVDENYSRRDLVHLFEHLVMRHDSGSGELPTKLELAWQFQVVECEYIFQISIFRISKLYNGLFSSLC